MLKLGVAGIFGRMGQVAAAALRATDDLQLVAGFARRTASDAPCPTYTDLDAFFDQRLDVVVDFTTYPGTRDVAFRAIERGVSPVIGATGWTDQDVLALRTLARDASVGAMLVPNFAIGAVLMMRFAEEAARYFPTAEIVELHHDQKLDKPSGTAKLTAARMAQAGLGNVAIHSVRLRGLVAHQEVLFGGPGETLTIRHDSLSRESFAAGIVAAVRYVSTQHGLVVGLDHVLESRVAQGQAPYDAKPTVS